MNKPRSKCILIALGAIGVVLAIFGCKGCKQRCAH